MNNKNLKQKFVLRWGFDYLDGKPSRCGQWNRSGPNPIDYAMYHAKNVKWAFIEAMPITGGQVLRLVEVSGQDFRNFQWQGMAKVPVTMAGRLEVRLPTSVIGLSVLGRDKKFTINIDGKMEAIDLTAAEKKINFAIYGK